MLKRYAFFALLFLGFVLGTVTNARAQGYDTELWYDGTVLQGYSETYGNPYMEYEECQSSATDAEGYEYCAIDYIYEYWVSVNASLNGSPYGAVLNDYAASVSYYVPYPGSGTWTASADHFLGLTTWENDCSDSRGDCTGLYWARASWTQIATTGPVSVPIQHLTFATYNVSSFFAPGYLALSADPGIASVDFQYTFNGVLLEADNFTNGGSSYVGADQPYLFGIYKLQQAKSHADGDWAWVTVKPEGGHILTAVIQAPQAIEAPLTKEYIYLGSRIIAVEAP